jgi:spore coat polysaccharide biosynthesis protein SpsF
MTSTRLPGKVLLPVLEKPMLEYMIERVLRAPEVDAVMVATTVNDADQPIVDLAQRLGVGCFRGSENDVLDRVLQAAISARADVIVELTGDCPLIDPTVISSVIRRFKQGGADYVSNVHSLTYPIGMDTQVFPVAVLAEVDTLTQDPADREHVSLHIYEHPERYRVVEMESELPKRWHGIRLTLDTPEDFRAIGRVLESLYPANPEFSLEDILNFLDGNPALLEMNKNVEKKPVRS